MELQAGMRHGNEVDGFGAAEFIFFWENPNVKTSMLSPIISDPPNPHPQFLKTLQWHFPTIRSKEQ